MNKSVGWFAIQKKMAVWTGQFQLDKTRWTIIAAQFTLSSHHHVAIEKQNDTRELSK